MTRTFPYRATRLTGGGWEAVMIQAIADEMYQLVAGLSAAGEAAVPVVPRPSLSRPIDRWEDGGGKTRLGRNGRGQIGPMLPTGIESFAMTHYRVGRYCYTDLGHARAELLRREAEDPRVH